jgi:hypothetical protein
MFTPNLQADMLFRADNCALVCELLCTQATMRASCSGTSARPRGSEVCCLEYLVTPRTGSDAKFVFTYADS